MLISLTDTIAAPATPPGISALSVIRISGRDAIIIVSRLFSQPEKLITAAGYQAVHGYIVDKQEPIDEVMCLVFRTPHSYTGEDMVEISGHGNPDLSSAILRLVLRECRMAEPGEFTFRAFMNHKLDLVQAEAVCDLISAQTSYAEKAALNQLKGKLSAQIRHYISALTDCRIKFELSIDFADQDLPELDLTEVQSELETLLDDLEALFAAGMQGKILRDGYTVCLAGAPNVGKSSIFNLLLDENRAIVTSTPGTTRDYLDEWINLEGYPVRLIDTAGLRETQDLIEQIGIDRTREIISHADLTVCITAVDALAAANLTQTTADTEHQLTVLNKIDLLGYPVMPSLAAWRDVTPENYSAMIPCSAILPAGLEALRLAILQRISLPDREVPSVLVTNSRHLQAIEAAINTIHSALAAIETAVGYEFIAFDLITAVSALSEITGAVTTDEMLERIFSGFCIGK